MSGVGKAKKKGVETVNCERLLHAHLNSFSNAKDMDSELSVCKQFRH